MAIARLTSLGQADENHYNLIRMLGIDGSGNVVNILTDSLGRLLLAFEGDLTATMGDVEKLLSGSYWQRSQPYLYGSGRTKYLCKNTGIDAALATTTWRIWKFSDAAVPQTEGPRVGRADSAANIDGDHSWNI